MKRKFIIYGTNYGSFSGGSVVLHRLCHWLNELGEFGAFPSYTFELVKINPEWNEQICDDFNPLEDIVIYPEIIKGNPLEFKRVIRWCLNSNVESEKTFSKTDLVFYYCDFFYYYSFNKERGVMEKLSRPPLKNKLYVMNSCEEKFVNKNLERKGSAILIHKAAWKGITIKLPNEPYIILDQFHPIEQSIEILNKVERLISYDTASYYSVMAVLCGANSIVVPENGISPDDWKTMLPTMKYGVAYGFSDLEHMKKTRNKTRAYIKELDRSSRKNVQNFLGRVRQYYG